MAVYMDIPLTWLLLSVASIGSMLLLVFFCICWQGKKKNKSYVLSIDKQNSELANNNIPHIVAENKQKYFLHGVTYSAINNSDEYTNTSNTNDHFAYNILNNIFKNIQRNKFVDNADGMTKVLTENLEDSNTDVMHKNFEKSVLCFENSPPDVVESTNSRASEKDDAYSCISTDSKTTFKSAAPFYRSQSMAQSDTYQSVNSEN